MNKLFNKAVLNGTTVMGDGLTYPRIPNVYTGDNEGGYQRGDMMDANAVVEMIKELTDTGKITIEELQNLINEEIQERVEGDQDQQRYTDQKIKDLIGTSPETLDTLKEIADALGEDPDFAANVWEKLAEVDQTLEDYKRASNLPDSVISNTNISSDANNVTLKYTKDNLIDGGNSEVNLQIPIATMSAAGVITASMAKRLYSIPPLMLATGSVYNRLINVKTSSEYITLKYYKMEANKFREDEDSVTIPQATTASAGVMSFSDKTKLDSLVNYKAGNGIDITGDTISCTLDTSLYSIVTELPETGLPNKIYLLPSTKTEEGNIYTEYGYVDNKWEELGKYKADVDLSPYAKALNLPKYVFGDSNEYFLNTRKYNGNVYLTYSSTDLVKNNTGRYSIIIPLVENDCAGLMLASDKAKLDGIEAGAQVNTIESISVNGTPLEITNKGVNIPNATTAKEGLMSKEDKAKLDSQPTIKASDATGVTDDDYVVIKKSEYQSILDRLSALENKA